MHVTVFYRFILPACGNPFFLCLPTMQFRYPMKFIPSLFLLTALSACRQNYSEAQRRPVVVSEPILNKQGSDLAARFNPPEGYRRYGFSSNAYGYFLRHIPLKPHGAVVHYFDGREKSNPHIYAAVLPLDVGNKDLQQCADAVMRLRAEYFYKQKRFSEIEFTLTKGFRADFDHWQQGYRPDINESKISWIKTAAPANDYQTYRAYLDFVYAYAGTLSLSRTLKSVPFQEMQVGDVLIIGGSPGHAVTVMDMAQTADGKKIYLLSQSYMPAQDIQILENPDNPSISPWYELKAGYYTIHTPQWDFTTDQLKRFP